MPTPESQAKKAATAERRAVQGRADALKAKNKRKTMRRKAFDNAAKYEKEYADKDAQEMRLRRQARANGNFYVPETARLLAVIRIRGVNDVHPKSRNSFPNRVSSPWSLSFRLIAKTAMLHARHMRGAAFPSSKSSWTCR